jgi:hypothetical protein
MIKSTLVTATSTTIPSLVYTSSTTGAAIGGGVTGQVSAITTIALCNIGTPSAADETTNAVNVNIYLAKAGVGYKNYPADGTTNLIVSNLTVPAGETVFFNDERIILDSGDEIYVGTSAANLLAVTVSSLPV